MARKIRRKSTKTRKQGTGRGGATLSPAERQAREQAIVSDIEAGKLTYREIAAKHSVSLPTVNTKARKFGLSRRPGRTPGRRDGGNRTQVARATRRVTGARAGAGFSEELQALMLRYRPDISLAQFERLRQEMLQILG